MYRTAVAAWHTVWRTLRKTLKIFFSRVLHDENHVLHPLLPERNDHGYVLRRCERGLFLRQTMPNAISFTDSCIGHQPTFYCVIAICQFKIPGKRIRYVVQFVLMKTRKCVLQLQFLGDIVDFA